MDSGLLKIQGTALSGGDCGRTVYTSTIPFPPNNGGSGQSFTQWGTGTEYLQGVTCNLRGTYAHELTHVVGMGHTVSPGQIANPGNAIGTVAGFGDQKAELCIYGLDFNPNNCNP